MTRNQPIAPDAAVAELRAAFEAARDPARASAMAAYMRDQFPFVGIPSPARRALQRAFVASFRKAAAAEVLAAAQALWELPEREYQYVACDLLGRHARRLGPGSIVELEKLVLAKSWWDTVDALAAHVVGPLVLAEPGLVPVMDSWAESGELWLERAAILHQLTYKGRTDESRLFAYCRRHAASREFFHRKAIGWGLREYAKTAPTAVRTFVAEHTDELSPLSRREALRRLEV